MQTALLLGAVAPDRIVSEAPIALRLGAELHDLCHEVDIVRAREEHRRPSPHRETGEHAEDVDARLTHIGVAPQLARNAVDDDERLLVSPGQFVRLVKELPGLKRAEKVARGLVLDADEIAVSVVADLDGANAWLPLGKPRLQENLKAQMPSPLPFVNRKNWHFAPHESTCSWR